MSQGQCLCGSVRFAAAPAYQWLSHCHCSMCRKHYGTLFGTLVGLDPANFRWLAGEADIVHYADSKLPWLAITDGLPQFAQMPPRERIGEILFGG